MKLHILGLAAAAVLAPAIASAATLTLSGTTTSAPLANYDLLPDYDGTRIEFITGDVKSASNGLSVNGPALITYTYLGSEAGNVNYSASVGGVALFDESTPVNTASTAIPQASGGLLDFSFGTSAPAGSVGQIFNAGKAVPNSSSYAIGYFELSATSYVLFFDDIASGDRDFDDFVMRVDVAAVPLPAALPLLLGGVGVLAAVGARRKRRAA